MSVGFAFVFHCKLVSLDQQDAYSVGTCKMYVCQSDSSDCSDN